MQKEKIDSKIKKNSILDEKVSIKMKKKTAY